VNRDQKAAVIEEIATEIREAEAIIAVDYRGISVRQAGDLRLRLGEAGASFRVVKNTLTERAADQAGNAELKQYLEGPTAFAFVHGDAAPAAKALAGFRRESRLLEFKGGLMGDQALTADDVETIARLPGREALQGQFVGVLAAPVTGLVRGLGGLLSGLAVALGQVQERGSLGAPTGDGGEPAAAEDAAGESSGDDASTDEPTDDPSTGESDPTDAAPSADAAGEEPAEAPGDPVAEAVAAENEEGERGT
jgi:large subunit ribosomal protein L10